MLAVAAIIDPGEIGRAACRGDAAAAAISGAGAAMAGEEGSVGRRVARAVAFDRVIGRRRADYGPGGVLDLEGGGSLGVIAASVAGAEGDQDMLAVAAIIDPGRRAAVVAPGHCPAAAISGAGAAMAGEEGSVGRRVA